MSSASTVDKRQLRLRYQTLFPTMKRPKRYKPQLTKKATRNKRVFSKKRIRKVVTK